MNFNITKKQAELFVETLYSLFKYNIDHNKSLNMHSKDFLEAGVEQSTLDEMIYWNFIAINYSRSGKEKPIWIAWKNPIYEDFTIEKLIELIHNPETQWVE